MLPCDLALHVAVNDNSPHNHSSINCEWQGTQHLSPASSGGELIADATASGCTLPARGSGGQRGQRRLADLATVHRWSQGSGAARQPQAGWVAGAAGFHL